MESNDILRRIRYMFDFDDSKMIELFGLGGMEVTRAEVSDWLKKEGDDDYEDMLDVELASFLNGLIVDKRGKKEGAAPMVAEEELNNNIVFRKLKIALNLKSDDIMAMFKSIDKKIGPHELSAFLRNPKQSQYRECNDQYLRYFLNGIQMKYRKH